MSQLVPGNEVMLELVEKYIKSRSLQKNDYTLRNISDAGLGCKQIGHISLRGGPAFRIAV